MRPKKSVVGLGTTQLSGHARRITFGLLAAFVVLGLSAFWLLHESAGHFVADRSSLSMVTGRTRVVSFRTSGSRGGSLVRVALERVHGQLWMSVRTSRRGLAAKSRVAVDGDTLGLVTSTDYVAAGTMVLVTHCKREDSEISVRRAGTLEKEHKEVICTGSGPVYHAALLPYIVCWARKDSIPTSVTVFDPNTRRNVLCKVKLKSLNRDRERVLFDMENVTLALTYTHGRAIVPREITYKVAGKTLWSATSIAGE